MWQVKFLFPQYKYVTFSSRNLSLVSTIASLTSKWAASSPALSIPSYVTPPPPPPLLQNPKPYTNPIFLLPVSLSTTGSLRIWRQHTGAAHPPHSNPNNISSIFCNAPLSPPFSHPFQVISYSLNCYRIFGETIDVAVGNCLVWLTFLIYNRNTVLILCAGPLCSRRRPQQRPVARSPSTIISKP